MRSSTWRSSLRQVKCHKRFGVDSSLVSSSRNIVHTEEHACFRCHKTISSPSKYQRRLYSSAAPSEPTAPKKESTQERPSHRSIGKVRKQSNVGIPAPPPLPDWFLHYNVKLQEPESNDVTPGTPYALLLLDTYNDAELLTVPFYDPDSLRAPAQKTNDTSNEEGEEDGAKTSLDTSLPAEKSSVTAEVPAEKPVTQDLKEADNIGTKLGNFFRGHVIPGTGHPEGSTAQTGIEPSASKDRSSTHKDEVPGESGSKVSDKTPDPAGVLKRSFELAARSWATLHGQLLTYAILKCATNLKERRNLRNLLVLCPNQQSQDELDAFVEDVSDLAFADVVRIDASDIAELAGEYVDSSNFGPGTISALAFDAYEGAKAWSGPSSPHGNARISESRFQGPSKDDLDQLAAADPMDSMNTDEIIKAAKKAMQQLVSGQSVIGVSTVGVPIQGITQHDTSTRVESKDDNDGEASELHRYQQLKLKRFFNNLLDAPSMKSKADLGEAPDNFIRQKFSDIRTQFRNPDMRRELHDANAETRGKLLQKYGPKKMASAALRLSLAKLAHDTFGNEQPATTEVKEYKSPVPAPMDGGSAGTIIHIRDIHLIVETPHGEDIMRILVDTVAARQKLGQPVMIIATSAEFSGDVVTPLEAIEEDFDSRGAFVKLRYPAHSAEGPRDRQQSPSAASNSDGTAELTKVEVSFTIQSYPVQPADRRLLELNLRHIQESIHELGIESSPKLFSEVTRSFLYARHMRQLSAEFLSPSDIQKIVLTAEGFRALYTTSPVLDMTHLAVATVLISKIESSNAKEVLESNYGARITNAPMEYASRRVDDTAAPANPKRSESGKPRKINLDEMRRFASKHEQRLFSGIADPDSIKTTYDDVHVAKETVDSLKSVTTLALLRPEAFSYGVLARDRLPGLLLYGPPGTGKTLLAKAVAKDASARVLEISGAQVYEKYVGEGEKMVKAVFSLAKQLSPCVVFIDEADALFGSRGQSSNRVTHREIINQFLREWDGMDDHSVFIMVATNRPFDLDDAVLRRLPRRILVDLPTKEDRAAILKIHLVGEQLDESVSIEKLAEQTPFYSGSDLKNVCVAAALAVVKEENEKLAANKDNKDFQLPKQRTLSKVHFDKAIQEISASISEDMSSLNAIKKFDERYGDRRGRRKKTSYGFEAVEQKEDESAARVRGDQDRPRP